jgi:hypothetical protein
MATSKYIYQIQHEFKCYKEAGKEMESNVGTWGIVFV